MNLENIVGGTENSRGGIDGAYRVSTGFSVNNGQIVGAYNTPTGFSVDNGVVRSGYNTDTGIRQNGNGTFVAPYSGW